MCAISQAVAYLGSQAWCDRAWPRPREINGGQPRAGIGSVVVMRVHAGPGSTGVSRITGITRLVWLG